MIDTDKYRLMERGPSIEDTARLAVYSFYVTRWESSIKKKKIKIMSLANRDNDDQYARF